MSRRPSSHSTSDRLEAIRLQLPELIDAHPGTGSFLGLLRRGMRALFSDVDDAEERSECLRAFVEIGHELGVPAVLVNDALHMAKEPGTPRR